MAELRFPDTSRKAKRIADQQDATAQALRLADEVTVEVWSGGGEHATLLARYEKREQPLYSEGGALAPEPEPGQQAPEQQDEGTVARADAEQG